MVTGPALGQPLGYRMEEFQLLTAIFRAAQVLAGVSSPTAKPARPPRAG